MFTFSTYAFIIPTELQHLSVSPLWVVEFHTRCLCNREERHFKNNFENM